MQEHARSKGKKKKKTMNSKLNVNVKGLQDNAKQIKGRCFAGYKILPSEVTSKESHAQHLGITCTPYGYHMPNIWLSHACQLGELLGFLQVRTICLQSNKYKFGRNGTLMHIDLKKLLGFLFPCIPPHAHTYY